jgi:histidinol dehydrogenase
LLNKILNDEFQISNERMRLIKHPSSNEWKQLCERPAFELDFLESSVKNILARVKKSGDAALKELTLQFDKVQLESLSVSEVELKEADQLVSAELKAAIKQAAANIQKFHSTQLRDQVKVETMPGVECWRKVTPIQKVGIYIPGGSAPLFSTVLMLGIPAQIAQCKEVVLCSPPDASGKINPAILFAASLTGIKNIFKVGGAQAIAAMAYGTESIPSVFKIFGPGNQFVTKAKQMVNTEGVAIDMPAGPSEVMVIADEYANPSFIASDLLSQAEHGADSQVVLLTNSESLATKVLGELENQLKTLPRAEVARQAIEQSLAIILEPKDFIAFADEYAPEHLIINTKDCDALAEKVSNAGSLFLGPYSPESVGDYASGTNHTLPTNGFAKSYGGVSVDSFVKYITIQKLSKDGLAKIGPIVETMAEAEQLRGHANAVRVRY